MMGFVSEVFCAKNDQSFTDLQQKELLNSAGDQVLSDLGRWPENQRKIHNMLKTPPNCFKLFIIYL